MPHFTVKDASDRRFEGDFSIDTDPAYSATGAEKACLEKVDEILRTLADDQRQDQNQSNHIQPRLAAARLAYRKNVADQLRSIAEQFANGTMALDKARTAINEAANSFPKNRPDFAAQDKSDGERRFEGDFVVTATNYQWDDVENTYVRRIAEVLLGLSDDETADQTVRYSAARLKERRGCRKEVAKSLARSLRHFARVTPLPRLRVKKRW